MTYYGSTRVIPHYNVMGVAKASLEASIRYLASDFGEFNIRVNGLSPGPLNTLAARGITYVPDFLCNRMGIVTCANEQYGAMPHDPAIERHFGSDWDNALFVITQRVLARAAAEEITPAIAANRLADELARQPHPIWPGRSRQIIDGLLAARWHERR